VAASAQPFVCPVLVGRDSARAEIDNLVAKVKDGGSGGLILISGEAGIGKSRLLLDTAQACAGLGWHVLRSACFEQDRNLPFSVLVELLDDILSQDGSLDARALLAPHAPVLARLLPRLGALAPDETSPQPLDAEQERHRLAAIVIEVVAALSTQAPCLLSVEDLHWSDDSSLDLLLQLARKLHGLPVLLLLTYRDDETTESLQRFLAHLDRERLAVEVSLQRLTMTDVDIMLRATLSQTRSLRSDLLQTLLQLTDGNPFFVEEVLRSLVADDGSFDISSIRLTDLPIPRSVSEAVSRRTRALSADALSLLRVAAVAGVRFDFDLLSKVTSSDEQMLLPQVRELLDAHLVVEETPDRLSFRHALTREAVRSGMLSRERRSLSARIAQAIEELHRHDLQSQPEDLAYHFTQAAIWDKALLYSRMAGEKALAMYAPSTAVVHLTNAIEAAARATGPIAALRRLRGTAYEALGNFELARADYEAAAWTSGNDSDPGITILALLDLGLLWASRDYGQARGFYERAVELARVGQDRDLLAHALKRLGNWYSNVDDYGTSRKYLDEALALFRELGDRRGEAETLDLLGMDCLMGGRRPDAATFLREAAGSYEALGEKRGLTSALSSTMVLSSTYQTSLAAAVIPLSEAILIGEKAVAVAREVGSPADVSYALWQSGFCLGSAGHYRRALACANEAFQAAQDSDHRQWMIASQCLLGSIYTDLLQASEGRLHLHSARALSRELASGFWVKQSTAMLIEALLMGGQVQEAKALLSQVLPQAGQAEFKGFGDVCLAGALADLALAERRYEDVLDVIKRLDRFGPLGPRLLRLLGLVRKGMERHGEAIDGLREAEIAALEADNLSLLWRIRADLASLFFETGDRDEARSLASLVHESISSLAAGLDDPALAASFEEQALLSLPAALRRRSARAGIDGLTAREAEIAFCIARGLSNRAIADELVLSARTVETHVANALAKLGFVSRAQLAAWAAEHHLSRNPQ
jgi:DNA-binding CsgD family transcriptional regulator